MRLIVGVFFALVASVTVAFNCKDSGVFSGGKLMSGLCWDCYFPMVIAGVEWDPPEGDGSGGRPAGGWSNPACVCTDDLGVPVPGVHTAMWDITHAIETVGTPYCSPFIGGVNLKGQQRIATGGNVNGGEQDSSYLNLHVWTFPVSTVLQLFVGANCNPGHIVEIDMSYISEPDPLWNDEVLTVMVQPESMVFSNLLAQMACVAECAAMHTSSNVSLSPWCVGCWGNAYPSAGFDTAGSSAAKLSSILSVKALNAMHRRLMLHKTYGSDAMCGASVFPSLLKEQYRLGFVYPGVEGQSNHQLGEPTIFWANGMTAPDASGQTVQVLYRYRECCTIFSSGGG